MVSCGHSASISPSARCRFCWNRTHARARRPRRHSGRITSRQPPRSISSPCPRLPAASCSCWSLCRIAVAASHTSTSRNTRQRRGRLNKSSTLPGDIAPRWLHRDRDSVYSERFRLRLAAMSIVEVVSAPASPWQNPYVERLIGLNPPRVFGPHNRAQRATSATHPHDLQPVLSSKPNASWAGEGRARSAAGLTTVRWADYRDSGSRRASSPLRAAGRISARTWRVRCAAAPV
jgi:hypothetical protein